MTNRELGNEIRETLKRAGYNVRDNFSVRVTDAGYSTTVHVTIKNPAVDPEPVRKIMRQYEDIGYDARGEILEGANTYVRVEPVYGLYLEPAKKYAADAADALCKATDPARTDACIYRNGAMMITSYYERGVIHLTGYEDDGHYMVEHGRLRITAEEIDSMAVAIYKLNTFGRIA